MTGKRARSACTMRRRHKRKVDSMDQVAQPFSPLPQPSHRPSPAPRRERGLTCKLREKLHRRGREGSSKLLSGVLSVPPSRGPDGADPLPSLPSTMRSFSPGPSSWSQSPHIEAGNDEQGRRESAAGLGYLYEHPVRAEAGQLVRAWPARAEQSRSRWLLRSGSSWPRESRTIVVDISLKCAAWGHSR